MLALAQQDPLALAQAHNILGMLSRSRGNYPGAVEHFRSSLDFAGRVSEPGLQIAALNNLAHLQADLGTLEEAIQLTQSALELCNRIGDRHQAAALHNHLADLFHAHNHPVEAMSTLNRLSCFLTRSDHLSRRRKKPMPTP